MNASVPVAVASDSVAVPVGDSVLLVMVEEFTVVGFCAPQRFVSRQAD